MEKEGKQQQQDRQNNVTDYKSDQIDHPYCSSSNIEIGKTFVSDKHPNTIDSFWFAVKPDIIVNPFDYVAVEQSYYTKTIGMIQDLQTIIADRNYILSQRSIKEETSTNNSKTSALQYDGQHGVNIARVSVMANSELKEGSLKNTSTGMPVKLGKSVRFANVGEVMFALGIPEMAYPIPAGIIEMSNGLQIPVYLDISYLVGPDTIHVNASGISGNAKTSYLLFLLQSVYQKLKEYDEEFALVIFNTKEGDLLNIHDGDDEENKKKNEEKFGILNLKRKPFENVTYFLPRGKDGKPNSIHIPENAKTYSYELADVYDRLELLFSEIYDPHYNLSSIVNYIYEFWPIKKNNDSNSISEERKGNEENVLETWTDLFNFKGYPGEIITHKSSLLHFQGHVQRFRRSSLFIDKKVTSTYLGKEIKQIRSGDVFVIDIAMLSELEQQAFVIGDVMKSIDEMYSLKAETVNIDEGGSSSKSGKKPKYMLIFIDEINRFLPKSRQAGRMNTVAEQIMKTLITGRSRGTILFSAQQFKSTVDYALHENTGMHITAKVGLSELSTAPYNIIDDSTKMNIVRLNKGELVMIHSAFRHPIKITFPKASFKKT
jgi:hypothetical protein